MLIEEIEKTLSSWMAELDRYSLDDLVRKPDPESWSRGQVFMHLVEETRYYMEQMEMCLASGDHATGEMMDRAKKMFADNQFPDEQVKGDPFIAAQVPQPASVEQLGQDWQRLESDLLAIAKKIVSSSGAGKTPHPGLGYFSAREWLQYADMHMRHHVRQKRRLDEALKLAR